MNRKIIIALCFFGLLVAFGCTQPPETPPTEQPPVEQPPSGGDENPPPGSDRDEHGCIGSAGYTWCESTQECVREWETPCKMSEQDALMVAQGSDCAQEGVVKSEGAFYNDNSKTWWFELEIEKPGCSPACVVHENGSAEINWRCTGLLPEEEQGEDDQVCEKTGTQYGMTLEAAKASAMNSLCTHQGELTNNAVCNEITGTWWIDIDMTVPRPGCSPACVVDVETGLPDVNWRCTGLAQ
ncbi:MAG: hypothetical protein ABII71_01580 [Candidatus Micrarchaeota archaeon]